MSYQLDLSSTRKDLCSLLAWSLLYESDKQLTQTIRKNVRSYWTMEIGSTLLSLASRLRIVQDVTGKSNLSHLACGEFLNEESYEPVNTGQLYAIGEGEEISFTSVLDKILHATMAVEPTIVVSADGNSYGIELVGEGKRGKGLWGVHLDVIRFCDIALKYLDEKEKQYMSDTGGRFIDRVRKSFEDSSS